MAHSQCDDPIASGLVVSLARPGGNITGLSTLSPETSGKRLELLKEIIPKLSRVAMFGTSNSPGNEYELEGVELAAAAYGIKVQYFDVLSSKDFETAFLAASQWRADAALMNVSGSIAAANQKRTLELAAKNWLPVVYSSTRYVEAGGFMSYGVHLPDMDRRAAIYIDKILKGTKPADLPVEQPTRFELVINLKTAKQIGLTIQPHVLARADRVIR